MYWRQALLAAGFGVALGAVAHRLYAVSVLKAVALALGGYVCIRVLLAAYYRTRYWLDRPNKHQSRSCGNCGEYIYRRRGDLLLHCGRCGWTAGWPGVRWVTRSVPVRQIWRSITWPRLGVLVVAVGLVLLAPSLGALPTAETVASAGGGGTSTLEETTAPTETPNSESQSRLDRREIERHLRRYMNQERSERGLSNLTRDEGLVEIARYHSKDMAENAYFAHESPSGETMSDRYEKFEYRCRASTGGNRYLTGAENIAYTIAFSPVEHPSGGTVTLTTEKEIARNLIVIWMNSPPHKENILHQTWDDVGHGVYIERVNGELRVYATQNFC